MKKNRFAYLVLFFVAAALVLPIPSGAEQAPPRLRILLSNDDGIASPGIVALFERLSKDASVTVVAPSVNHSGAGHAYTFATPIVITESERWGAKWFSVDARPATSVKVGLEALLEEKPDLVVSGINRGDNVGLMTHSSGTVGVAREAAYKGVPVIAMSMTRGETMDYESAADFLAAFIDELRDKGFLEPGLFLNVNYPALPKEEIKGVRAVPLDKRPFPEYTYRTYPLEGRIFLFYTFHDIEPGEEMSDVQALRSGYITLTPLRLDQTDSAALEELKSLNSERGKDEL